MNWFKEFESELSVVFEECEAVISRFPAPLHERGLQYLQGFHPFRKDSAKNYICYLLPFWVKDLTHTSPELCRKLSLANVFVMLYFFVQDDLMDTAPEEWKEQLALANLFYVEFLEMYREHFPSDSPLWSYFRTYITEWTLTVVHENDADYFYHHAAMIAKKAGPLKLASTAALLLNGQAELISVVSSMVDRVLLTLQMMDDFVDWSEDLLQGSYNCLISLISSTYQIAPGQITEEVVNQALYLKGIMNPYAEMAAGNHKYIEKMQVNIPYLEAFHQLLCQQLQQEAERIDEERTQLLEGGLHYYLSKSNKI
ncbi:hypothetical protein PASE110613_10300 [Paenibacillus sediminis]|uniref:Uncharacterized protein n=1 Tax=Paenibacillus sediminis TaxID=664909 RepID=A0ABS4H487_9BACL|nr:hypothetical protein [Paenibacillus sediminis]MBP1937348.1 hypothetical protein [Paenibacillus sediminis]